MPKLWVLLLKALEFEHACNKATDALKVRLSSNELKHPKHGMCSESIKYVTCRPFLHFIRKDGTSIAAPLPGQI